MRRSYVLVALAVTSLVALAFALPLAFLVRIAAHDRAVQGAERRAASIAPVLAVTAEPPVVTSALHRSRVRGVAVVLPDGTAINPVHAPAEAVDRARESKRGAQLDVAGGVVLLRPVAHPDGRVAVVEAYVPAAELDSGVRTAWLILAAIALALVGSSVLLADRLAGDAVRATRDLTAAARRMSDGDLTARADPTGPAEIGALAGAFNTLAEAFEARLVAEREFAADLSHRLRTPLTAVRLNTETLPAGEDKSRLQAATADLEREVSAVIQQARRPYPTAHLRCDLAAVLTARVAFWTPLAEDQGRPWDIAPVDGPLTVAIGADDLADALDTVIGNVFQHTPEGTACKISVASDGPRILVLVADAGPGIPDAEAAVERGTSGGSSTGLGLDIARRVARSTGGELTIGVGPLGGAQVGLSLGLVPLPRRSRPGDVGYRSAWDRLLRRGRHR
ncbi:HAMP domain-containing protein [Longispora urticae]